MMQNTSLLKRRMRATKGKHTLNPLRQQFVPSKTL